VAPLGPSSTLPLTRGHQQTWVARQSGAGVGPRPIYRNAFPRALAVDCREGPVLSVGPDRGTCNPVGAIALPAAHHRDGDTGSASPRRAGQEMVSPSIHDFIAQRISLMLRCSILVPPQKPICGSVKAGHSRPTRRWRIPMKNLFFAAFAALSLAVAVAPAANAFTRGFPASTQHSGPYDDTGHGPNATGLEGGGG